MRRLPLILSGLFACLILAAVLLFLLPESEDEAGARGNWLSRLFGGASGGEDAKSTLKAAGPQLPHDGASREDEDGDAAYTAAEDIVIPDVVLDSKSMLQDGEAPPPVASPFADPAQQSGKEPFGGRVIDVRTGRPIAGVQFFCSLFHAPQAAEGDLMGISGTPGRHQEMATSDGAGAFSLPLIEQQDPQALLHVQAVHPRYAPAMGVLVGRDGADGMWRLARTPADAPRTVTLYSDEVGGGRQRVEFFLRPALTLPVRISGESGELFRHVPVRVIPQREGYDFRGKAVEIAYNGRLTSAGEPYVLFTDSRGELRLPFNDKNYSLELLDPYYYLVYRPELQPEEQRGRVSFVLPYEGTVGLVARAGELSRHRLVDADGFSIANADVEVQLEGMVSQRLRSDAEGFFEIGLIPFPLPKPPLGYRNPRGGKLTILSSGYHRRGISIELPNPDESFEVPARRLPVLKFRLVTGKPDEPDPVAPRGLRTSLDLIPRFYGRDGIVEFVGAVREGVENFDIRQLGYRIREVSLPERISTQRLQDLGDIFLEEGLTREFRLDGESAARFEGAELSLRIGEDLLGGQSYRVPPSGVVQVSGLYKGEYSLAVSGPWIKPYITSYTLSEDDSEPFVLPIEWTGYEEVWVAGLVVGMNAFDAVRASVVERYHIVGRPEPITMPPYPLTPGGYFGGVRYIEGLRGVTVSIITVDEWAADFEQMRDVGPPVFGLGEGAVRRYPRADIEFEVPMLGKVEPPVSVAVRGTKGMEELVRIRIIERILHIDNLRRGSYTLLWEAEDGATETFPFVVRSDSGGRIEFTANRSPRSVEELEISVVDSKGEPVDAARAIGSPKNSRGTDPGIVIVKVRPAAKNSFVVYAPDYISTGVQADPGETIPTQVTLYKGAEIRAKILDSDGLPYRGTMDISWESLEESVPVYGKALEDLPVQRGRLSAKGLPPVLLKFRFQAQGSDIAIQRTLQLPEQDDVYDLGTLRLEETRTLLGTVRLPDGTPARDTRILLLPRQEAYRYPLVPGVEFARVKYRTQTDDQGVFRLEGLPLTLSDDHVLVASRAEFGDAVEDPLDWSLEGREMFLQQESRLDLEVGYRKVDALDNYRFVLEYRENELGRVRELGEIVPDFFGFHQFLGIRPGSYRVRWELREQYSAIPGLWEDVFVPVGGSASLRLRIDAEFLRGKARLNGSLVQRGWILLTYDPGDNGGTRVGRITNGEFLLVDPPSSLRAYAAVIPEGKPQAMQNISRGEARPLPISNYSQALRQGWLDFDYAAHDLTLRFTPQFLAKSPGSKLVFDHYEWDFGRFRKYPGEALITEPNFRLHLLSPKIHRFTLRSQRGGLISSRTFDLTKADLDIEFR